MSQSDITCGLQNIGNTCYMDAVLQSLAHCDVLRKFIVDKIFVDDLQHNIVSKCKNSDELQDKLTNTITIQLFKLFNNMLDNQVVQPVEFKNIISSKNNMFAGTQQNDAHELLNLIFDSIHEENKSEIQIHINVQSDMYCQHQLVLENFLNKINNSRDFDEKLVIIREYFEYDKSHQREVINYNGTNFWIRYVAKNFSVITQNMTGVFLSSIKCDECDNYSNTFEPFTSIQLEIPSDKQEITLYDCFDDFISSEQLHGENKYNCQKCDELTRSHKQITFWRLPNILVIQLMRFNTTGRSSRKNNALVKYPRQLNLHKYVEDADSEDITYELSAVIHHGGGVQSGHYWACCNTDIHGWMNFDDSNVRKINECEFNNTVISDTGYILFYTKQ